MAKNKDVEGQGEMFPDTPEIKALKKNIRAYEKLKDTITIQSGENREAEMKSREKVFESFKASGIDADAEGKYHITIDGYDFGVGQDAQLKIKRTKIKQDSPVEPAQDEE